MRLYSRTHDVSCGIVSPHADVHLCVLDRAGQTLLHLIFPDPTRGPARRPGALPLRGSRRRLRVSLRLVLARRSLRARGPPIRSRTRAGNALDSRSQDQERQARLLEDCPALARRKLPLRLRLSTPLPRHPRSPAPAPSLRSLPLRTAHPPQDVRSSSQPRTAQAAPRPRAESSRLCRAFPSWLEPLVDRRRLSAARLDRRPGRRSRARARRLRQGRRPCRLLSPALRARDRRDPRHDDLLRYSPTSIASTPCSSSLPTPGSSLPGRVRRQTRRRERTRRETSTSKWAFSEAARASCCAINPRAQKLHSRLVARFGKAKGSLVLACTSSGARSFTCRSDGSRSTPRGSIAKLDRFGRSAGELIA